MNKKSFFLLVILIISGLPLFPFVSTQPSEPWLTGWTYRKSHFINGSSVGEQTNYQVKIIVNRTSGSDSGDTVYVDTKCLENFGDIRFTSDDEATELDYWLESVDGSVATFWVEVGTIPASGSYATIYIYYGKADTATTSSIDDTFIFGDDFSFGLREDTWDDIGTVTIDSSEVSSVEADYVMKREGITRDDDYYYISYVDTTNLKAYLIKFNASTGDLVRSIEVTDGTLYHPGGIDQDSDGYIYVPLAEYTPSPSNPSKIQVYNKDLTLVETRATSSGVGNDHWGGIAVDEDNNRMYIANWGTAKIYTYNLATGAYISTESSPPYSDIQDMQYLDGYIYGSLSGSANIAVMKVSDWSAQGLIGVGSTSGVPHTYQGICIYTSDKHDSEDADGQFYLAPWAGGWSDSAKKKVRMYNRVELNVSIEDANSQIEQETTNYGPAIAVRAKIKFTGDLHNSFLCDDWPDFAEDAVQLRYGNEWILRTRRGAGSPDDDDTGLTEDTDWHIWEIKWYDSSGASLDFDNSEVASVNSAPSDSMHLGFQNWASSTSDMLVGFVFVRKYVDPEPEHWSWGGEVTEDTAPTNTSFTITDLFTGNVVRIDYNHTYVSWVSDVSGHANIDTICMKFTSGGTTVELEYNHTAETLTTLDGSSVIEASSAEEYESGNDLRVTFYITLNSSVPKETDIDLFLKSTDISSSTSGYEEMQTNYFSIEEIESEPWLSGWAYRKSHFINGSTIGEQTDYQVKIIVGRASGSDYWEISPDWLFYSGNESNSGPISFSSSLTASQIDISGGIVRFMDFDMGNPWSAIGFSMDTPTANVTVTEVLGNRITLICNASSGISSLQVWGGGRGSPYSVTGVLNWTYHGDTDIVQSYQNHTSPVEVVISYNDDTLYVGTQCLENFGDIRFTSDDEETELDYWLESVDGSVATFWVEVDTIPASGSYATIYIYYGKADTATTSSIDDTFIFGDDFSFGVRSDTWDDTGTVTIDSAEISSVEADYAMKREGITRDDDYYYISYVDTTNLKAYLIKFNASTGDLVNSVEIHEGTLYHPGGIDQDSDGYIYVPLAENVASPSNPSKIQIYNKELTLVETRATSSGVGDDHWGGIAVDEDNNRMYIANWGTAKIYTYNLATGAYISTESSPPYSDIQDMQYLDGYIYGSDQDNARIVVMRVSDWSAQGIISVGLTGGVPDSNQGLCIYSSDKEDSEDADGYFYLSPYAAGWSNSDKKKVRKYERPNLEVLLDGASAEIEQGTTDYGPSIAVRANITFTGVRHNAFLCDDWPDGDAEDLAVVRYNDTDWELRTRVGAGSANDNDTGKTEDTDPHIWELKFNGSTSVKLDMDGSEVASVTTAPSNGMHLGFQNWASSTSDQLVGWVVVRKYVDPEPEHWTWGEEDSAIPAPTNTNFTITDMFTGNVVKTDVNHTYVAWVSDLSGHANIDNVKMKFTSGGTTVELEYNHTGETLTTLDGSSVIEASSAEEYESGNDLRVTFYITLNQSISSDTDIDLFLKSTSIDFNTAGYEEMQTDYFSIVAILPGIGPVVLDNGDAVNWVFQGNKRYQFTATYTNVTLSEINQVGLGFTDDIEQFHSVLYSRALNTLTVDSPDDGISGWLDSITQSGDNVEAVYLFMFNTPIPDTINVVVSSRLVTTTDTGWSIAELDLFNIYNLGGLTTFTSSGYSGRRSGGDAFEIYAADALVAILANENFETAGELVYSKVPFYSGSPLLRIEFNSLDWVVNEAPPFLNVTIIDEYINADSRPYAYTGDINTPTWRDGDQCLHVDTATVSNGYPSAFKRFRRPITNTAEVQELITATVFWQGGLSGGVNTTTSHIKISDLPTTLSASNTAVDIQLESILDPGGAGHVRVRDGATQKVAAIGGDAINWEVHNWYNVTIQVNVTSQTWTLIWEGSATNATDIDFFETTTSLEWFGVVGANGLGGGEAVDFYIDALKVTTDYDEDLAGDVTAKATFNMLQHWSMDFDWDVEDGYVTSDYANMGFIELGWDICIDDVWVNRALWARINITEGAVPKLTRTILDVMVKNQNWVEFEIEWYEQSTLVKTSTLYGLYEGYKIEPTPGQKDVIGWHWDIWFNKMDSGSWMGGRVNTEWFGMSDKSIPWMVWTSNWKPMTSDETESTVFVRLKDASDDIRNAKDITLVRPWVRVVRTRDYTFHYEIKNIQGQDFMTAKETMSGIDTPAIRPTQAPFIMGGFLGSALGAIFAAGIKRLANALSGFGLSFFTLSVDFIENIVSALGYPGLVSSIFSWMGTLFDSVPTLVGFALTFIGNIFNLLNTSATDVLTQLTSIISIWVNMYAGWKDLLDGALTPGINLWTDLGLNSFVQIGAVLYPMWLLILWSDKGTQALIDHLTGILNIFSFFFNFILNVAEFFIGLLQSLIGAIRG